jgi:hypothetical protein
MQTTAPAEERYVLESKFIISHAAYEMIRNKAKGANSQMKDLLMWNKRSHSPETTYESNYGGVYPRDTFNNRERDPREINIMNRDQQQQQYNKDTRFEIIPWLNFRNPSVVTQPRNEPRSRGPQSELTSPNPTQRAFGVLPSYQKYESNKQEINFLENELRDLDYLRKQVNDDLDYLI